MAMLNNQRVYIYDTFGYPFSLWGASWSHQELRNHMIVSLVHILNLICLLITHYILVVDVESIFLR